MHPGRSSPHPHPAMQRIEAHPVRQLGRPVDIPDREVAPFADFERTGLTEHAQRAPARVTPARHSATVIRNSVAPIFMASRSDVSGELPGLQSVASAMFTPWARNSSTGGLVVSRMK